MLESNGDSPPMTCSVVIPVFNSEGTLRRLHQRLTATMRSLGTDYELVFVHDGGSDRSWPVLTELAAEDFRVVAIDLERNFGQHRATLCGLRHARGDAVVTIDDDLQFLPEDIPALLRSLLPDVDVVYGVYARNHGMSVRGLGSRLALGLYALRFRVAVPPSSFRAIRRRVLDRLVQCDEASFVIDSVLAGLTRRISGAAVRHQPRQYGSSGYRFAALVRLTLAGLVRYPGFQTAVDTETQYRIREKIMQPFLPREERSQ
jgi:glycosyltransferase involved in cell wall biosynthesis